MQHNGHNGNGHNGHANHDSQIVVRPLDLELAQAKLHIRDLIAILEHEGGYMSTPDQSTLTAARWFLRDHP